MVNGFDGPQPIKKMIEDLSEFSIWAYDEEAGLGGPKPAKMLRED